MASIKDLAKYIYDNQKKGFSDAEIYQLLEQSGWQLSDIDEAFKKAHLLKNIDVALSAPTSYFIKNIKSASSFIMLLPSTILKTIPLLAKTSAKTLLKSLRFIFSFVGCVFNGLFIGAPSSISSKITRSQNKKRKNKATIEELSKYIEKNLKSGSLENDIFIELLKIGWDKKIIDKSFSKAHSQILKENLYAFSRFLILSPFIAIKKITFFVATGFKKAFFDLPRAIVFGGRKAAISSTKSAFSSIASLFNITKDYFSNLFKKKPVSYVERMKPAAPRVSFIKKVRIYFIGKIYSLKSFLFNIFKKPKVIRKEERPTTITVKISPWLSFWRSLKYFFTSYPQAIKRVKQKFFYAFAQSVKQAPSKIFSFFFNIKDFIRYDLRFALQKILIHYPARFFTFLYSKIKSINLLQIVKLPISLIIVILRLPLRLFSNLIVFKKKFEISIFILPFEIAEFAILKIFSGFKKILILIFAPIIPRLKPTLLSFRRIFVPPSKELGYVPQALAEIPVGEVADTMRPLDILRIAARMFKTRRLRTFLTILGIGIGIGAILFLVSLGYGLQRILIEEIATSDALLSLDLSTRDELLIPLDKRAVDSLSALPEVLYVSPLVAVPGQISLENITANTMINGTLPNYFKLGGITAPTGELFKEGETNKILISLPIVKLLSPIQLGDEIPQEQLDQMIGKQVSIILLVTTQTAAGLEEVQTVEFKNDFIISGVVEDSMESLIYFPLSQLEEVGITKYQSAKVRVVDNNSLEVVRAKAVEMGFIVAALSDTIEQANKVFQVLQIILAMFGIVALAVSAIGMFNTMTIALLERTQEIGIMKSLGASNKNVWELFLAESIIMGFLGGVGGVTIGYLGSEGFNLFIRILAGALGGRKVQLFERPWWFIITILVFSTVVGLFTGLWPAKRAARINILQALRYK